MKETFCGNITSNTASLIKELEQSGSVSGGTWVYVRNYAGRDVYQDYAYKVEQTSLKAALTPFAGVEDDLKSDLSAATQILYYGAGAVTGQPMEAHLEVENDVYFIAFLDEKYPIIATNDTVAYIYSDQSYITAIAQPNE